MAAQKHRFWEIEGLRAWLAWAVVISHLFVVLSFYKFNAAYLAPLAGEYAVKIFILISGFVIANLVLEQKEAWAPFITRRAFRIFPAYLVALIVGAIAAPLAVEGLSRAAWASDPHSYFFSSSLGSLQSTTHWPLAHWFLHLTLLQGIVPDDVLPWSGVAFVGPAWSLSLEWQFYLLAPLLVLAMRSAKWAVAVVALAFVSAILFQNGAFGAYSAPSTLLGGLWLFLIGIASRLVFPTLRTMALPATAIAVGAIGIGILGSAILPVALWIAFLVVLAAATPTNPIDRFATSAARVLVASPLAKALGARSYSVYVMHMPILKLMLFALPLHALTQMQALGWLALTALPLTLVVSEVMYRLVERPMIKLGAQLAARQTRAIPAAA